MTCTALTIAGSDSGGGAGIQADLKTFAAHRVYGTSVLTAVTAQNTRGVTMWEAVPPALVRAQIVAVVSDIRPDAVKLGMLANAAIVDTVADALRDLKLANVVLDPVMIAKGGARLLEPAAVDAIRNRLLRLADVVTPNVPEAEVLSDVAIGGFDERYFAGEDAGFVSALKRRGPFAVPRPVVITSGRKLRAYSAWRILGEASRWMRGGKKA